MRAQSQHTFVGASALLFAASAAVTVLWCESMSSMGGMEMPGGWTMSMAWMRMPGQSWSGAAASFVGMWVVMTVAMMLPSLVPMLARYRRAVCCQGERRLARVTMLTAGGYFAVWTALGLIAFLLGVLLATMTMQLPALSGAVPMATAVVVVIAGALQFSSWKARHLACCRGVSSERGVAMANAISEEPTPRAVTPWAYGVRMGLHCVQCCAGLTAILLVMGVMDLRAMAIVAAAITLERLAPAGERVARIVGVVVVAAGLYLVVQAAGAGG